jgi:hypothetical protein
MKQGRSDHTILLVNDKIFVLGGMNFKSQKNENNHKRQKVVSLNTCEVYNLTGDSWSDDIPPFEHARQQFSACHFNERFIFLFGGKKLTEKATINGA